jgi:hypothetical protein
VGEGFGVTHLFAEAHPFGLSGGQVCGCLAWGEFGHGQSTLSYWRAM